MTTTILKVLVGSHAHGLARPDSDRDYRGVFVNSTRALLTLGPKPPQTAWQESEDDETAHEVGKFLFLATKCNPTILEVFWSPIVEEDGLYSHAIIGLRGHVWAARAVRDAFRGYGLNQRKKMLSDREEDRARFEKYSCAYLRSLYAGTMLLSEGRLPIEVTGTAIETILRSWREGRSALNDRYHLTPGEVVDTALFWDDRLEQAYEHNPDKQANLDSVNEVLWDIRKAFLE